MIISIIGNNASGKTTLAETLGQLPRLTAYFESHTDRPYQALFSVDPHRFALKNQLDYLLARAEQEQEIRAAGGIGVQDGGLDQDFHLYTRLFHHKGFLDKDEFLLCERAYLSLRAGLPAPELYIYLTAPLDTLRDRLQARGRSIDLNTIVTIDDLPTLQGYLEEWTAKISPPPLTLGADEVALSSPEFVSGLETAIQGK
ncbi:MAG: deoxynucleoside kinase [Chloroflexota bacterium]